MNEIAPWRIRHMDLAQGGCALPPMPPYRRVIVCFWWKGVPLGMREYDAGELPRSATVVAEDAMQAIAPAVFAHSFPGGLEPPPLLEGIGPAGAPPPLASILGLEPLSTLERILDIDTARSDSVARLSVVVCTRNRPDMLTRCLESLMTARSDITEIIVVDNDPASEMTRRAVASFPGVVYVAEPVTGLSAARNAGILASSGDVIAFTDDDVEVHRDWAKRLKRAFTRPDVAAVTGLILPATLETDAQIAFEKGFGGFSGGYRALEFDRTFLMALKARGTPVWRLGAGANMAVRRDVFRTIGMFDERLGAGAAGCSEDSELWYRLLAAGFVCRYDPTPVVFHHHRQEWSELRRQVYQYMRGHVAALLVQFWRHKHWGNLRRAVIGLPAHYLAAAVRQYLLRRRRPWPIDLLWAQIRGCLAGFLWIARRLPQNRRMTGSGKLALRDFLARNPFPHPFTLGFFYREKMRAIHAIAPEMGARRVLEIGGGRSGLTSLLYPQAHIVNIDLDFAYADAPHNRRAQVRFVCGDATKLPFADGSFDAVTMFDLLEHVRNDAAAAAEALRVVRRGGCILVSTPSQRWRHPYYAWMKPICRSEREIMAEWGHVRRSYDLRQLERFFGGAPARAAGFITPLTVIAHDVSFSALPERVRRLICMMLAPVTWLGYVLGCDPEGGTEIAALWRRA